MALYKSVYYYYYYYYGRVSVRPVDRQQQRRAAGFAAE